MARLLDEFLPRHADENQARLAVGNIIALQLGWRLLGPFLRPALGLGEMTDDDVRAAVGAAAERLAEPPAAHH